MQNKECIEDKRNGIIIVPIGTDLTNIKRSVGQPKKPNNILYQRRFDKSLVTKMDEYLTSLKMTIKK